MHRFRSGMTNGLLWFVQMCYGQKMGYNVYNQTKKPLVVIFLSVCFPVRFFLKALHLLPQMYKFVSHHWYPPGWNCIHMCRHHLPMRHKFMMGQSVCFSKVIIPEWLNLIDIKSNFAPKILNLMHMKSNLEGACFFTYTSGGFIHIHLTRQLQCEAGLWEPLCCVLCNTAMLIELVYW